MTDQSHDSNQSTSSPPEGKSFWETAERISKTLSIAAIPIVLAVVGWIIQERLQDQSVRRDYVQLAVTVLKEPGGSQEMKDWAVELLNGNSPVRFNGTIVNKLKDGSIQLPTTFNVAPVTTVPGVTTSTTPNEDAENWELKGFGFLFDRDADSALQAFRNAEKLSPEFHNVAEIRKLLDQTKPELSAAAKEGPSVAWKNLYATIKDKYSWRLSSEIKSKLMELSK